MSSPNVLRSLFRNLSVVVLLAAAIGAFRLLGPNAKVHQYLYVKTGATYNDLLVSLKEGHYLAETTSFDVFASMLGLKKRVRPGRYDVTTGMSNLDLIRKLRNGSQAEVKLVINKLRTRSDLFHLLATNLETDSATIAATFTSKEFLDKYELDTATLMCAIMPNTYEFYWNTPLEKVLTKFQKAYNNYWTDARKELARQQGVDAVKATIIASIIEEETNAAADKPNIASVYLNRLNKGMKLQADPTVKYAIGDFKIKRITNDMLKTASPYNTYVNTGLPPGPICTPMPETIDAVLNAPKTNYLYFCADADLSGRSVFAATGAEHMKNAHAYQQALNERGIH